MGGAVVSRLLIVSSGLLYPAYNSYKAVKAASLREYVRWIMYWVVFALFTTVETFTDIFLSWFPFYYTVKVLFVFWLSLPYTRGSTLLYRKLIHPNLSRREQDIDLFIENAKDRGYQAVVDVGSKGLNLAANAVVTAAVKGQAVVTDKLKSYSVMDISSLPDDMPIHAPNRQGFRNPQLVRERLHSKTNPSFSRGEPSGPNQDENALSSQFQAYSMFNLSDPLQPGSSENIDFSSSVTPEEGPTNELCYFDNEAPTHTNDDMRIPRRTNYAEESVAEPDDFATYCRTMPKNSKSSHQTDYKQMPPMPTISHKTKEVRRSKRRQKNEDRNELKEE